MDTIKFWAVFAIGVGAGAAVALVYAPQAGKQTREQLKRKLDDAADYVKDAGGDLRDRASDAVRHGKDVVDDLIHSAPEAAHNAAKRVADSVS